MDDAKNDNNSIISLSPAKMEEISLFRDNTVLIKWKKGRDTMCIVLGDETCNNYSVWLNKVDPKNLWVQLTDIVAVSNYGNVPYLKLIHILPLNNAIEGVLENLFDVYLKPHILDAYHPVKNGNFFLVCPAMNPVEFKVVETDSASFCIVTPDIAIQCKGDPVKRLETDGPDLQDDRADPPQFKTLGIKPPAGSSSMPPWTLIARAVANETDIFSVLINGPEIMSKMAGKFEFNFHKAFEEVEKNALAIIFIDEIDSITPKRKETNGKVERHIISQLLTLMDGLKQHVSVVIIGAANCPNSMDVALRRFRRLDREINIGIPDDNGQLEVFRIHMRNMKLAEDVNPKAIAGETHGFIEADIDALCSEMAMHCIWEKTDLIDIEEEEIRAETRRCDRQAWRSEWGCRGGPQT
ncbi:hypothetical protein ACHAWF_008601 [Thalassiosira exigua]